MGKQPAFQFFPGDWFKDPELRSCSLEARGAWFEIICLMVECKPMGLLSTSGVAWDEERIAMALGGCDNSVTRAIEELKTKGVLRKNHHGFFFSKRLVELRRERVKWNKRKKNQRVRAKNVLPDVPLDVSPLSHLSSSSSSSSSSTSKTKEREETPSAPNGAFDGFWLSYPRKVGRKEAEKIWRRMSESDRIQAARGLAFWKRAEQWNRDGMKYIPHGDTFLRSEQWKDEPWTGAFDEPP